MRNMDHSPHERDRREKGGQGSTNVRFVTLPLYMCCPRYHLVLELLRCLLFAPGLELLLLLLIFGQVDWQTAQEVQSVSRVGTAHRSSGEVGI